MTKGEKKEAAKALRAKKKRAEEIQYRDLAREVWAGEHVDIEEDAEVSISGRGAWVAAWVWLDK